MQVSKVVLADVLAKLQRSESASGQTMTTIAVTAPLKEAIAVLADVLRTK